MKTSKIALSIILYSIYFGSFVEVLSDKKIIIFFYIC